jgi:hypothetical protein
MMKALFSKALLTVGLLGIFSLPLACASKIHRSGAAVENILAGKNFAVDIEHKDKPYNSGLALLFSDSGVSLMEVQIPKEGLKVYYRINEGLYQAVGDTYTVLFRHMTCPGSPTETLEIDTRDLEDSIQVKWGDWPGKLKFLNQDKFDSKAVNYDEDAVLIEDKTCDNFQ